MSDPAVFSLKPIARALGGECYAAGRRALVPAPGHGPADRSVSLVLEAGRVVVHSFGQADWRDVLDALRAGGWIDAQNRLRDGAEPPRGADRREPTRAERVGAATHLWATGEPIGAEGPAARHARLRCVALSVASGHALRVCVAAPLSVYRDRGPRLPALLAAITGPDGALTAVEVTYLNGRGERSTRAKPPRKTVGVIPPGSAVRLAPAADEMLVAEGVFTTLSAMARFGLAGWALLSTSNMRSWRPPPGVRRVLIAADRGRDGGRSAATLRRVLRGDGLEVAMAFPPAGAGDWNDLAQAEARRASTRPGEGWRKGA